MHMYEYIQMVENAQNLQDKKTFSQNLMHSLPGVGLEQKWESKLLSHQYQATGKVEDFSFHFGAMLMPKSASIKWNWNFYA